jgi:hypothetical protein
MTEISIAVLQQNLNDHQKNLELHKEEVLALCAEIADLRERVEVAEVKLKKILGEVGVNTDNLENDSKSLRVFIKEVLQNSNEPLTAREIADSVREAGYKTTSVNFQSVVLMSLKHKEFKRATRVRTRPARFGLNLD